MKVKRESEVAQSCLTLSDCLPKIMMDGTIQRDPNYHSIKGKVLSSSKRNGYKKTILPTKFKVSRSKVITLTYRFPDPDIHWDLSDLLSLISFISLDFCQPSWVICCCSVAHSCPTLCDPMGCNTPGFPVLHHLPELAQTHVHWVSDAIHHFVFCHSLLLLPLIFPSIRVFSNEWALHIRWPKYWSFSFSISPSNEYLGLISFRIDWFDLLAAQGTLKNLLQHHSSKASILWCSPFFMVQLSNPYMTTWKTTALPCQQSNVSVF